MSDERDPLDEYLRAVKADKGELSEWVMSNIRQNVAISQEQKNQAKEIVRLREELEELAEATEKDLATKASQAEFLWSRRLLFTVCAGALAWAGDLLRELLIKVH